eukprot:TRINITY_DN2406_c0_g2_i1.p2 TRINITY_DN2406_c0_g2~~TRINITY_DN2406_c0_g2_i1.p2  ORF type:complete len:100 (-),score=38.33 TRINITY_DN2406_c0_g2_i1:183-482(-)
MMRILFAAIFVTLAAADAPAQTGFLTKATEEQAVAAISVTDKAMQVSEPKVEAAPLELAAADTRNEYEKTNIEAEVLAALFFAASLLICVLECCPPGKK